ncbi:molybdopterin synthase catalytic subunit [Thrips palmi]|uniref:Molybdopterin synthase catalytic subunit n=1 Tax=Thrips palmi TaxID=161013 RepID=A0A6P8YQR1_THRPL|nr:molybdopterin synthase catalytic subunit [Thrips palmi]
MDHLKLVKCEINVVELMKLVSSPSCGATSMFVGTTRDNFEGKTVKKLIYEAYEGMAEKSMKKLCDDIRSRWKVHGIAICHRLGEVAIEEASIAIVISSEHRAESLQAVQYAIDTLKAEVPIWKKEEYEGSNESAWKENKESSWIKTEPAESVVCDDDSDGDVVDIVPPDLIQVKADDAELKRRMEAFMDFKRNQVNFSNIRDFCGNANSELSCARVDAVVVRQKGSKGHLRVRRVLNKTGPQTQGIELWPQAAGPSSTTPLMQGKKQKLEVAASVNSTSDCPPAVEERLRNAELHLGLNQCQNNRPVPKDVYARLKDLEDRILFLEGVSPEYSHVLTKVPKIEPEDKKPRLFKKRVYSVDDLDKKMRDLENVIKNNSPQKSTT